MSSKTRKLIWSVPLVATLAVVGALAVFVALGLPNANPAEAQGGLTEPSMPQNSAATAGNMKITVQWRTPSDPGNQPITGYVVQYLVQVQSDNRPTDTASGWMNAPGSDNIGVSVRQFVITDLANDLSMEHFVRVAARNGPDATNVGTFVVLGEKGDNDNDGLQPANVRPSMPRNLAVTVTMANSVTLSWTVPADNGGAQITGYEVFINDETTEVRVGDGPGDVRLMAALTGFSTSATVVGLDANIPYTFRVAAINGVTGVGNEAREQVTTKVAAPFKITGATIKGFSTSPNGEANIVLRATTGTEGTTEAIPVGGSVVIFLEDDFQVPDTISPSNVFFTSAGQNSGNAPYNATRVVVDSDDYDHVGTDAHTIRAYIPDMNPAEGASEGIPHGTEFTLNIVKEAGIRNHTQAGTYEVAYQILRSADSINGDFITKVAVNNSTVAATDSKYSTLSVPAKVALSDENNKRDYELTIIGSGLNSGRTATAHVLEDYTGSMPSCETVVAMGESVGSAAVGSDHTAVVVDTVTTDDYSAGMTNYICMRDDNAPTRRMTTVKPFEMEPSIAASPAEVSSGDEVTVAIRDFSGFGSTDGVNMVSLSGKKMWDPIDDPDDAPDDFDVVIDVTNKELTFDMPGGVSGSVEISVTVGTVSKQATIHGESFRPYAEQIGSRAQRVHRHLRQWLQREL